MAALLVGHQMRLVATDAEARARACAFNLSEPCAGAGCMAWRWLPEPPQRVLHGRVQATLTPLPAPRDALGCCARLTDEPSDLIAAAMAAMRHAS